METGLIHLYKGDGKGKTTAAVGLAVRAAGSGRRVIFAQFLKGSVTGEVASLEKLGITVIRAKNDMGFFRDMDDGRKIQFRAEQNRIFDEIRSMVSGVRPFADPVDMLVLDEVLDAAALGLISKQALCLFVMQKPENLELVITGRADTGEFAELADYVTDMRKIKHPYDRGIKARLSIEY